MENWEEINWARGRCSAEIESMVHVKIMSDWNLRTFLPHLQNCASSDLRHMNAGTTQVLVLGLPSWAACTVSKGPVYQEPKPGKTFPNLMLASPHAFEQLMCSPGACTFFRPRTTPYLIHVRTEQVVVLGPRWNQGLALAQSLGSGRKLFCPRPWDCLMLDPDAQPTIGIGHGATLIPGWRPGTTQCSVSRIGQRVFVFWDNRMSGLGMGKLWVQFRTQCCLLLNPRNQKGAEGHYVLDLELHISHSFNVKHIWGCHSVELCSIQI